MFPLPFFEFFGNNPLSHGLRRASSPERGSLPPQSAHCVRSQLPQGDAFAEKANFPATAEAVPLGKVA